ncbi:MAG: hypothetical protein Q9171_007092 [Xanthocarpia ochracea]
MNGEGEPLRAIGSPARAVQSSGVSTIALDPDSGMLADAKSRSVEPVISGNAHQVFDQKMKSKPKRKRRQFSPSEKEHIKNVRKVGACDECKQKKRKCTHVTVPDGSQAGSDSPDSDVLGPITPESAHMLDMDFSFENMLNLNLL